MNWLISIWRWIKKERSFPEINSEISILRSQSRRNPRNIAFYIILRKSNAIRSIITSIHRNSKCFSNSIKCKSNYISILPFTSKFLTTIVVPFLLSISINSKTMIIIANTILCIFLGWSIKSISYPSHLSRITHFIYNNFKIKLSIRKLDISYKSVKFFKF